MGKTLLLYYTFEGNTGFVAERMAENMDLTVERLVAENEPPKKGFGKLFLGGLSALTKKDPALYPINNEPKDFDSVILAFPIWAGSCPPAVSALIKKYPFEGKKLYVIACSSSGRAEKAIDAVAAALAGNEFRGSLSLVDPLKNRADAIVKIAAFAGFVKRDAE